MQKKPTAAANSGNWVESKNPIGFSRFLSGKYTDTIHCAQHYV